MRRPSTSKINKILKIYIRNIWGTSLVVQWLRLQASIAGGKETKIPDVSWRGFWNSSVDKASACNAGVKVKVSQSWETLCNSMDHKVLRILQARILEWVAFPLLLGILSGAQMVKNQPAVQETLVRSLGREDLLEKEMVTHSSILAWRIPWTEEPDGLQFMESPRVRHDLALSFFFYASYHSKRGKKH